MRTTARWQRRRNGASGSTLAALVLLIAIMSIFMTAAAQQWSFIIRREKERELIFRGQLIALAMEEYAQAGRGVPTSLDLLTKRPRPTLRKVPDEPMTARYDKDGKLVEGTGEWKLLRQAVTDPRARKASEDATPEEQREAEKRETGPIQGVASRSEELSIAGWNEVPPNSPYSSWRFEARGTQQNLSHQQKGGHEMPLPPGFGGLRVPGGPPVISFPSAPGAGGQQPVAPRAPGLQGAPASKRRN
jgi:type II secretory pathway pseudopilin PulG